MQFFKKAKEKWNIIETPAEVFLVGKKDQGDDSGGRVLPGDNTGGGVGMLQLILFQSFGVWDSTGLSYVLVYHMNTQLRFAQHSTFAGLSKRNNCLHRGESV